MPFPPPADAERRQYTVTELTAPIDTSISEATKHAGASIASLEIAVTQLQAAGEGARILQMTGLQTEVRALIIKANSARDVVRGLMYRIQDANRLIDQRYRGIPMGLPARQASQTAAAECGCLLDLITGNRTLACDAHTTRETTP